MSGKNRVRYSQTRAPRWGSVVLLAIMVQATGCRDSFEGAQLDGIGARTGTGSCPEPGPLPFETATSSFESEESSDWAADNPYVTHWGHDVLGTGSGQQFSGMMSRSSGTLLSQRGVADEWVSLWRRNGSNEWLQMNRVKTDSLGSFSVALPGDQLFGAGTGSVFAILEGDGTCAVQGAFVWPSGTRVIVTDIDGTLTFDDNELFKQIMESPTYVPKENQSASEMLNLWADKGYRIAYLSARPHALRGVTRVWLHGVRAPFGPMTTADAFVYGESARLYKAQFLTSLQTDLGWEIVAAYGNADSDIQAYEDAGIPKNVTFIVGELAGEGGTVAIGNNDFTDHIGSYVGNQPAAQQPF